MPAYLGRSPAAASGSRNDGNEPVAVVRAPIIEAQIPETYLLSTLAFQSMVATKAFPAGPCAATRAVGAPTVAAAGRVSTQTTTTSATIPNRTTALGGPRRSRGRRRWPRGRGRNCEMSVRYSSAHAGQPEHHPRPRIPDRSILLVGRGRG